MIVRANCTRDSVTTSALMPSPSRRRLAPALQYRNTRGGPRNRQENANRGLLIGPRRPTVIPTGHSGVGGGRRVAPPHSTSQAEKASPRGGCARPGRGRSRPVPPHDGAVSEEPIAMSTQGPAHAPTVLVAAGDPAERAGLTRALAA